LGNAALALLRLAAGISAASYLTHTQRVMQQVMLHQGRPDRLLSAAVAGAVEGFLPTILRMRTMLELYHNDMSTCAQKVRFALAEKGVAWQSHHLDLRARDHQRPEYLRLNPNAVVPTIVHDGLVVIESTVINEYIDDAFAGWPLRPSKPIARARMRLWTKQLDEGLHADTGVLSTSIAFRYQKVGKGPDEVEALIHNVPDPVKRDRVRANIMDGMGSPYFKNSVQRFDRLLSAMEQTLRSHAWLAGDAFSLADIAYAPYVTRLDHLQLSPLWAHRPQLAAWYARLQERDGYREGLVRWFNPKYLALMEEKGLAARPTIEEIVAAAA
jgi:glutathione S-transferase